MGIVYIIQPEELVGTNRLKIGCSRKNDLSRIYTGYRKDSRFLCICESEFPFQMEKCLLKAFNTNFREIAGHEFFEGDLIEMRNLFMKCVMNTDEYDINADKYDTDTNESITNSNEFITNTDEYLTDVNDRLNTSISDDIKKLEICKDSIYCKVLEQTIACKRMLRYVFEISNGEYSILKYSSISYVNTEWKPRLAQYIRFLDNFDFNEMLKLFGLYYEGRNSKGATITYRNINKYTEKNSRISVQLVQKMVRTTFGITFVKANAKSSKMKFDNSYWENITKNNKTFLNDSSKEESIEDDELL